MGTPRDLKLKSVPLGFLLGVVLQILCTGVLFMLPGLLCDLTGGVITFGYDENYAWPMFIFGYAGVSQVIYMGPAYYFTRRDGASKGFLKGLVLAAVLLFVLNAGCLGQMYWG